MTDPIEEMRKAGRRLFYHAKQAEEAQEGGYQQGFKDGVEAARVSIRMLRNDLRACELLGKEGYSIDHRALAGCVADIISNMIGEDSEIPASEAEADAMAEAIKNRLRGALP